MIKIRLMFYFVVFSIVGSQMLYSEGGTELEDFGCFSDPANGIKFGDGECTEEEGSGCVDLGNVVLEICPGEQNTFPLDDICLEPISDETSEDDLSQIPCSKSVYVATRKHRGHKHKHKHKHKHEHHHGNYLPHPHAANIFFSFLLPTSIDVFENQSVPKGRSKKPGMGDPKSGLGIGDGTSFVYKVKVRFTPHIKQKKFFFRSTPSVSGDGAIAARKSHGSAKFGIITMPKDSGNQIAPITSRVDIVRTQEGNEFEITFDSAGNIVGFSASDINGNPLDVEVSRAEDIFLCTPIGESDPNVEFPVEGLFECLRGSNNFVPNQTSTRFGNSSICSYWYNGFHYRYPCQ